MLAFQMWVLCAVVCVSPAFAQAPRPSVMPFPLEFKRVPPGFSRESMAGMQREYGRLLRLAGAMIPDFSRHDLALKELRRTDCDREDECLTQLARKAEALYAIYASVDYTIEGAVVVSGRIIRDDGKIVSPTETTKLAKGRDAFEDIAKNALVQLFAQLKIAELPATRPLEPQKIEPVKIGPPPLVIEDRGAEQRTLGKGILITGAGVVVVGGALAAIGCGTACGTTPTQNGSIPVGQAEAVRTGKTLTMIGWVGLGVGAVVAGVGAILWGTAPTAPGPQVTVAPVAGGGVVQIGGEF